MTTSTMELYKRIDVWVRIEVDQVAVYRCFEALSAGGYCVQSKDFFHLPLEKEDILMMEENFLDLLVEEDPAERSGIFPTLEEAIAQHEREFSS